MYALQTSGWLSGYCRKSDIIHVATLRSQITSRGLKYIVIRTPFGYFKMLAEDILSGLDVTDMLTFRLNGKTLEIRHGTELIATAELVNK